MFLINLILIFLPPSDTLPPGVIKINDLYIDRKEVSNIGWLEYLYYLKMEGSHTEYLEALPDSSNRTYNLPNYRFNPITDISYEQARNFCKWRSRIVSKKLGYTVKYRLPTPEEWDKIATAVYESNEKKISRKIRRHNKRVQKNNLTFYKRQNYDPITFDLFWNVSEMTSIKGVAKGRSNEEELEPDSLLNDVSYNKSDDYLGFRCIAEW